MSLRARLQTISLLLLAACSGGVPGPQALPTPDLPARFWAPEAPAGARPVSAVHADAADGARVVLEGIVGGAQRVFVDGAAVFTLVDPTLKSCVGMDEGASCCATPWDYCCEDPAAVRRGTATIELRDGLRPLPVSPRGFHGLDHLSRVVVEGVAERDAAGNLLVAAERLHVRP